MTEPICYRLADAAEACGVSVKFLRAAINSTDPTKALRAKRLGDSPTAPFVIPRAELQRWVDNLPDA
jgi:hypothetical protein